MPNEEPPLVALFAELQPGRVLVVVDQLASIGALAVAVARSAGSRSPTCPGWRCGGSLTCIPARRKTDARDAYIIADAARTLPHALRRVGADDETRSSWRCSPATTRTWPRGRPG